MKQFKQSNDSTSFEHRLDHFDLKDTDDDGDDGFKDFPRVILFDVALDSFEVLEVKHSDFSELLEPLVDIDGEVLGTLNMLPVVFLKRSLNM